jgi:hypothetical protein
LTPPLGKSDETKTIVIMIDHNSSGGFLYRVDGRAASADFLTFLNQHQTEWPSGKTKVILLVHDQASLAMINNSVGMIVKAGYEPPRVFYFRSDRRAMVELAFLSAVPFSQSGPQGAAH